MPVRTLRVGDESTALLEGELAKVVVHHPPVEVEGTSSDQDGVHESGGDRAYSGDDMPAMSSTPLKPATPTFSTIEPASPRHNQHQQRLCRSQHSLLAVTA